MTIDIIFETRFEEELRDYFRTRTAEELADEEEEIKPRHVLTSIFEDYDALKEYICEDIEGIVTKAMTDVKITPDNIEITIGYVPSGKTRINVGDAVIESEMPDPKASAGYHHKSTNKCVHLYLNWKSYIGGLASTLAKPEQVDGMFEYSLLMAVMGTFNLTRKEVGKSIRHELRHHLDSIFLNSPKYKKRTLNINPRERNYEDIILLSLISAREEGFADYEPDNKREFMRKTENNRYTVHTVWQWLREQPEESFSDRRFGSQYNDLTEIGPDEVNKQKWVGYSEYIQGPLLIETIIYAKKMEISPVTPEEHREVLEEISEMTLTDFFRTYFDATEQLGIEPIFPKEEAYKALERVNED